jgi:hypothetical protein
MTERAYARGHARDDERLAISQKCPSGVNARLSSRTMIAASTDFLFDAVRRFQDFHLAIDPQQLGQCRNCCLR